MLTPRGYNVLGILGNVIAALLNFYGSTFHSLNCLHVRSPNARRCLAYTTVQVYEVESPNKLLF